MPHIVLPENIPGIIGPMLAYPETERHLNGLAEALLRIADKVRQDGRSVTPEDVEAARAAGADDKALHDTVLIAAAFCMFNRYVDGLATWAPKELGAYKGIGELLAQHGYVNSIQVAMGGGA